MEAKTQPLGEMEEQGLPRSSRVIIQQARRLFEGAQAAPSAASQYAQRLRRLLGDKRTVLVKGDIKTKSIIEESAESVGERLRISLDTGEFYERPADEKFEVYLADIDKKRFAETAVGVGWRKKDVMIGRYVPPAWQNVPELMRLFAEKLDILDKTLWEGPRDENARPKDYEQFVAWAVWTLLGIHPKRDGNGRFSKGFAEFLLPHKEIMGWKSQLWKSIFLIASSEMVERISKEAGAPGSFAHEEVDPSKFTSKLRAEIYRFYRWNGLDWSAEIIREAIDRTEVAENGTFCSYGLSSEALALMVDFIKSAPQKFPSPWLNR